MSARDGGGASPNPTDCKWQLGTGEVVSNITLSLFDQNSLSIPSFEDAVERAKAEGSPVYEGMPGGTRCVWEISSLNCIHGNWRFNVSGEVRNPDGTSPGKRYDADSPELQQKWLVPIASLVGPLLSE